MDGRQHRGLQIAAAGNIVRGPHAWFVPSQTDDREVYRVDPDAESCTCPDHRETAFRCKHLWAVEFSVQLKIDFDGTETLTRTAKVTYSQEWTTYNAAQTQEGDRFMVLLADLCRSVPQPPQANGRPRLPLSDMLFATTYKVYTRFSSRRFASDLREAHARGLISRVPHFNSVTNYMSDPALTPLFKGLITASSLPLRAVESDFAADSTGFSTSRFDKWFDHKYGREAGKRRWIKAHVMCGVRTNIVTAVEITGGRGSDARAFGPLVETTGAHFDMAEVSADGAYTGRGQLATVERFGAVPYMPFKSTTKPVAADEDSAWARMYHRLMADRAAFASHYHKRSNVETTFAMIKGKFGDAVLSKSDAGQVNEVLCKVLAHNVCVVSHEALALGIDPTFSRHPTAV